MATSSLYKTFRVSDRPEDVKRFEEAVEQQTHATPQPVCYTESPDAEERFLERLKTWSQSRSED